jgi:hypothetical protein
MKNFQKMGGIAALIGAATNLLAMVFYFTLLAPIGSDDPGQVVAFLRATRLSCAYSTRSSFWSSA